jgi:serine/threonine protein kinase
MNPIILHVEVVIVLSEHIYQGKRIDDYRIIAEMSSSSSSSVYLAEHSHHPQNSVVIKLFHSKRISAQKGELFLQEVQLLKKIKHAHILPILDAAIYEQMPYYITEYIPKGSLRDLLDAQSHQLLPVQESLRILHEVGQTLQYTHQMNIFHGNLKPENVLLHTAGDVLISDFIIVTLRDTFNAEQDYSASSFPYMAPEQFLGRVNKDSDQYALGCIAYELLTGQAPFVANGYTTFKEKHTAEEPIALTQRNLLLPISYEETILKALEKKSEDRFPTIKDFVTALSSSTALQARGVKPPQSVVTIVTTLPNLIPPTRIAETQQRDESQDDSQKELSGSNFPPVQETAAPEAPAEPSDIEIVESATRTTDEEVASRNDTKTPQKTPIADFSTKLRAAFLVESTAKVASIVAPMYPGKLAKNKHTESRRALRFVWAIAVALLLVILSLVYNLRFLTLPSTFLPKPTSTAISHKNIATVSATATPLQTSTATLVPTTIPSPAPASKAAPTAAPSPTATPSPPPTTGLIVTPSSFQLSRDCSNQFNHFTCTVNLQLSQNFQNNLKWSASGSGAYIYFNPQKGILSPGEGQQVLAFVYANCPQAGSLSFATKNGVTTIPWSC